MSEKEKATWYLNSPSDGHGNSDQLIKTVGKIFFLTFPEKLIFWAVYSSGNQDTVFVVFLCVL